MNFSAETGVKMPKLLMLKNEDLFALPVEKELLVQNERGMHLASAAEVAKVAEAFKSDIFLYRSDKMANAKSVLTITALMAPKGTFIRVVAKGEDAQAAVDALENLFNNRFGETR